MSANAPHSRCPKCDYARRGAGRPAHHGEGLWRCGQCGASWRDIQNLPAVEGAGGDRPGARAGEREPAGFADTLAMLRRGGGAANQGRLPVPPGVVAALHFTGAAAAVLAGWFGVSMLVQSAAGSGPSAARHTSGLELTVSSAARFHFSSGDSLQVQGRIANPTGRPIELGPVEIVMTDDDGKPLGRWRYRPAMLTLQAGQTVRFASAKSGIPSLARGVEIRFASTDQKIALGISAHADRPKQEDRSPVRPGPDRPKES